jgi:hypothetical protein
MAKARKEQPKPKSRKSIKKFKKLIQKNNELLKKYHENN